MFQNFLFQLNLKICSSIIFTIFCIPFLGNAQTDTINTFSNQVNSQKMKFEQSSYVVYMQDSLNGPKYNFEIWDRTIKTDHNQGYELLWVRNKTDRGHFSTHAIHVDSNFAPIFIEIQNERVEKEESIVDPTFYQYEGDRMFTSSDTNLHKGEFFEMLGVNGAFDWEMDLEILAALPWEKENSLSIKFYHPGSKSEPSFHTYSVVEHDELQFNGTKYNCALVRIEHSKNQSTLFWIDTQNHRVLQVQDYFYGRYRFKKLII